MKNILLSLFAVSLFITSCKQDDPPTPPVTATPFMSFTAGSTWNYEVVNNITPSTSSYTLTSTSKDSTINGKSYHVFTNSSGSGNEYYNNTGNDYFTLRRLPLTLGGTSVENLYLKDNVTAGTVLPSQDYPVTAQGFNLIVTVTNTIAEKGLTKTVSGNTYNDVIKVTTAITVKLGGIPLPGGALTTDIQAFYAPKYGLIQSNNKIDINFSGIVDHTDQQTTLKSADIK